MHGELLIHCKQMPENKIIQNILFLSNMCETENECIS